jgi:hypothetical protein
MANLSCQTKVYSVKTAGDEMPVLDGQTVPHHLLITSSFVGCFKPCFCVIAFFLDGLNVVKPSFNAVK